MSAGRPNFWRVPRDFNKPRPRPQSCVWSPPSQATSNNYDYSQKRVSFTLPEDEVVYGSPASDAGLRTGDVLLSIGNKQTISPPLTHAAATDLIKNSGNNLNVQVQRGGHGKFSPSPVSPPLSSVSPRQYAAKFASEPPSSQTLYRPLPTSRGVIPNINPGYDSSIRKPESNTEEFLQEKQREQQAIIHQTYRTLPLIEPRPKVRRDWPTGSYLRHMEGPTWQTTPKFLPKTVKPEKIKEYGGTGSSQSPDNQVVHLQYNSPLNIYSNENVAQALLPQNSPRPGRQPVPVPAPAVQIKNQLAKPLAVDITLSPTYQLLQEEEFSREHDAVKDRLCAAPGQSGPGLSPRPQHSPSFSPKSSGSPTQTPSFKTLMTSLL